MKRVYLLLLSLFVIALLATTVYADGPVPSVNSAIDLFAKGSRLWSIMVGRSVDGNLGQISLTQFNINDYICDNLAIHYGLTFGYAEAKRTRNGVQAGPELGMRKHFAKIGRWSVYVDGSVGAVFHQHPLAEGTLRFNFDVQPGFGATYRLGEKEMLRGGFGWHHLSNARIRGKAHNLGYDAPMFYLGFMQSF